MSAFTYRQAINVVFAMGWADFVLKYRGSFLGYVWSFVVPLIKFLVMLHIFRQFVTDIPHYPLYLFIGLILWEHFAMTTSACIGMLHDKSAIIKKILIPRIVLILSVGWMHLIILLTYVIIFLLFTLIMDADIPISLFYYLPVVLLQSTLIALGVGMVLSAFSLRYRDIQHLWGVMLQIIFWLTPIAYAYKPSAPLLADAHALFGGGVGLSVWSIFDILIRFQPLSILIHDARRSLLYADILGVPSMFHTASFLCICIAIFGIGVVVFQWRSRYFIQEY